MTNVFKSQIDGAEKVYQTILATIVDTDATLDGQVQQLSTSGEILRSLGSWLWNSSRLIGLLVATDESRSVIASSVDDDDAEWCGDDQDSLLTFGRRLRAESLRCLDNNNNDNTNNNSNNSVSVDSLTAAFIAKAINDNDSTDTALLVNGWRRDDVLVLVDGKPNEFVGFARALGHRRLLPPPPSSSSSTSPTTVPSMLLLFLSRRVPLFDGRLPFASVSPESLAASPTPFSSSSNKFASTATMIATAASVADDTATFSKTQELPSLSSSSELSKSAPQRPPLLLSASASLALRAPSSLQISPQRYYSGGMAPTTMSASTSLPQVMTQLEIRAVVDAVGEMSDQNVVIVNASGDVIGVSPIAEAVLERCCDNSRRIDLIFAGGMGVWQKLCGADDLGAVSSPDGRVLQHPFVDGTPCVLRISRLQCNVIVVVFEAIGTTNVNEFWNTKYGASLSRRSSAVSVASSVVTTANTNNSTSTTTATNASTSDSEHEQSSEQSESQQQHNINSNNNNNNNSNNNNSTSPTTKHRRRVRLRRQRSALAESTTIVHSDEPQPASPQSSSPQQTSPLTIQQQESPTTTTTTTTIVTTSSSSPSQPITTANQQLSASSTTNSPRTRKERKHRSFDISPIDTNRHLQLQSPTSPRSPRSPRANAASVLRALSNFVRRRSNSSSDQQQTPTTTTTTTTSSSSLQQQQQQQQSSHHRTPPIRPFDAIVDPSIAARQREEEVKKTASPRRAGVNDFHFVPLFVTQSYSPGVSDFEDEDYSSTTSSSGSASTETTTTTTSSHATTPKISTKSRKTDRDGTVSSSSSSDDDDDNDNDDDDDDDNNDRQSSSSSKKKKSNAQRGAAKLPSCVRVIAIGDHLTTKPGMLSFRRDEAFAVLTKTMKSGLWLGIHKNRKGKFPSGLVRIIEE